MVAPSPSTASTAPTAVVLVHGILSSSDKCFPALNSALKSDPRFSGWDLCGFDYDYNQSIAKSAEDLVAFINTQVPSPVVYLVCHSMGGLVARMGVLSGDIQQVKKLIMLGTPNFGACRTSRSALLMQVALLTAGHVSSVFRKPGILELTKVTDVMSAPVASGAQHADSVEYATVAGTFFNQSRSLWDTGQHPATSLPGMVSKTIGVAIELTSLIPLWRPAIERPHDGIVEHDSCALAPSGPGRKSEKDGSINHPDHFGRTYVHIFHEACDDLMHVTLQGDSSVIGLVKSLLLADSLVDWEQSLDTDTVRRIKVTPDD